MREKKTARRHPYRVLTAREVQTIKAPGRYADGGGLYLLIAPGGSKSWMLRTIVRGTRRDIGLGSVTLVSLAEARERATSLRKIARDGGDPLADRRRKAVPTFRAAAAEVHKSHSATFKNEKHRKQWLSSLDDAFKTLGGKPVDAISSADILAALTPSWLKRPETSRRVLQRIRVVMDWCKAQGYLSGDNPTAGITKVLPKHRGGKEHHAALPYADVPKFLQALRACDAGLVIKLAFELTILCATRTSETLGAEWSEIDLESRTWTIPARRMKAGVAHRIPLATRAVEILETAKTISHGRYVFPGRSDGKPLSNMAFLMTLRRMKRAGITAHGFRSSFRDWAAEQTNFPRAVCEAALAHTVRDRTEAAYNRTDLFERRASLMDQWSRFATEPGQASANSN